MNWTKSFLPVLSLALSAGIAQAQSITEVAGAATSPGTLIALEGTGLAATTEVRFTAFVGGFVGVWNQSVPVQSATDTRVTVEVPDIVAGWIPPGQQAGDPLGQIRTEGGGTSNVLPFYFFEGTNGFLDNVGLGTNQSTGQGRSIVSFTTAGGPPTSGNPMFTPTLHNATSGSIPFLALGRPGPDIAFGDGIIALNPAAIFDFIPGSVVDADGNSATAALSVPPIAAGSTFVIQWGYVDPGAGIAISNGMLSSY